MQAQHLSLSGHAPPIPLPPHPALGGPSALLPSGSVGLIGLPTGALTGSSSSHLHGSSTSSKDDKGQAPPSHPNDNDGYDITIHNDYIDDGGGGGGGDDDDDDDRQKDPN